MGRISNYPLDYDVIGSDRLPGSAWNTPTKITKNFTVDAVADYYNRTAKISTGQFAWQFEPYITSQPQSQKTFEKVDYLNDSIDITNLGGILRIAQLTLGNTEPFPFIIDQWLGKNALIYKSGYPDIYAIYTVNSVVQDGYYYLVDLTFVEGNSGTLDKNDSVTFGLFPGNGTLIDVTATFPLLSSGGTSPNISVDSGYTIPTDGELADALLGYNRSIISATVTGTTTKTLTLTKQDGGTITASWTDLDTNLVTSVFGRTGAITAQSGDYTTDLVTEGTNKYFSNALARAAISVSATGLTYNSSTGDISLTTGYIIPTTTEGADWDTAYNRSITAVSVTGTITKTLTLTKQDGSTLTASWGDYYVGTVTSVGVSMPSAFVVTNSPITTNGVIAITGAGTSAQYIDGTGALQTFPGLTGFVPYTGATTNVDLGEHGIKAGYVAFDLTPTGTPTAVGTMYWDAFYRTVSLIDGDGDTTLQIGQEERVLVHNNTGITLTDGQVVYVTGSTGELPSVSLASNAAEATSSVTFGVVTEAIANGADGFITTSGLIHGLNTLDYTEGAAIWLGSIPGTFTQTKPIAPLNSVLVGYIIKKSGGNGSIFVKIQNGYELEELHDVLINSAATGDVLTYIATTGLWENLTIAEILGYTPANAATTLTINGITHNLSANQTWSLTTDNIPEGITNKYLTNSRVINSILVGYTSEFPMIHNGDTIIDAFNYIGDFFLNSLFSVAGTTNVIDVSIVSGAVGLEATVNIASTYVGQTSITTLGTIGTGVWHGTAIADAYIASATTWNNKQNQLNGTGFVKAVGTTISYDNSTYLTTISGITAGGELSGTYPNPSLVTSAVTGKLLAGLNITGGAISSSDSILNAFGKLQNQINALSGSVIYQGTWNANTNSPTLTSSVGTKGYYYIVNVAGTTNLNGITDWKVGDWAIYDGTAWQKVDNTDSVSSVNGYTGAVSLVTGDIAEGVGSSGVNRLYYTNSRAIASTLTDYVSGPGTITASDTVLSAIQKLNGNISSLTTGVSSVSGTLNRITASPTSGSVVVDIASTYVGQASITTLGTIGTGTWNGTAIADTYIASSANWNTAYADRNKWDGGSTGLVAATGRTSLGATTVGSNLFTLTNPTAITFLRVNADNTVSTLNATDFRTAIGAGTGNGSVTSVSVLTANGVSGSVATATTTPAITLTLGAITPSSVNGLTLTSLASGFSIAGGTTSKTLTISNTLTLAGTDTSTLNIGGGGTLGSAAFTASSAYQPSNTNLTSLAGLTYASSAFVKMTGANTFTLDTTSYQPLLTNPVTGTGVSGQVTFFNGTSTITGDNGHFWDNTNKRLGIGTTAPYNKLELASNATNYSTSPSILFTDLTGVTNSNRWIIGNIATDYGSFNIASAPTATSTTFTPRLTINYLGNLGIGTTSPNSLLDLFNAGAVQLRLSYSATNFVTFRADSAGGLLINATASSYIINQIGGTELTRLTSSGNLGLGITPSAWSTTGKVLELGGANGNGSLFNNGINDFWISSNVYFNGTNWIYKDTGYSTQYHQAGGRHEWYTAPSGTAGTAITFTQAMTLDASGNLMVGTTSAGGYKLNVNGTGLFTNTVQAKGYIGYRVDGGTGLEVNGGDLGASTFIAKFNDYSNNTKVAILGNGSVGIGVTSPQAKLDVRGGNIYFEGASIYSSARAFSWSQYVNNTSGFYSLYGNGADRFVILQSGNVGIGTTSPSAKLDVAGDIYSNTRILADTFGGYSSGDVTLTTNTSGTANLIFKTSLTERMRISSTGNVSIGNTNNTYKLDVTGITLLNNTGGTDNYPLFVKNNLLKANNNYLGIKLQSADATNPLDGQLLLYGGTNPRIEISSYNNGVGAGNVVVPYGNLGIGTTTPGYKLEVNGSVGAVGYYETSDIRFKDVLEVNPKVDLSSLALIKYKLKDSDEIRYGYSAQDVQALCGDLVGGTVDKLTLNYKDIHSIKIATLEARVAELEAQLNLK